MAKNKLLTLRLIQTLAPRQTVWDGSVPGFGARRQLGDAVSYVLLYRNKDGRQRWHTIGRHGAPWTPETARNEARRLLGEVVTGGDPLADKKARRTAAKMADLCDLYLAEALAGRVLKHSGRAKKASTLEIDKGRIERHIKPLLGHRKVADVTPEDVDALLHDVAAGKTGGKFKTPAGTIAKVTGGQTAANRVVGLLGAIFTFAIRRRMRKDNPVHGLQRYSDNKKDRRLTADEYRRLGQVLESGSSALAPGVVAAVRFMALTGWRRGEVLSLRWQDVDLSRRTATLDDTKTGRSMRPLAKAACSVLSELSRGSELVFPSPRHNGIMTGFRKVWCKVCKLGGLPPDVTPHTLRHSFASLAGDIGYSEPTIAALIGHQGRTATSRYMHSADTVLLAAADKVANRTADLVDGADTGVILAFAPVKVAD